jgi:LuxR family maltose regulon positive regulatory protein
MGKPGERNQSRQSSFGEDILQTKLQAPRLAAGLIQRAGLLARLDEGLSRSLTLVAAPTGFGKTTLVSQWVHSRSFPSAWVTLDEGDDDPARFWDYLVSALHALDPGIGRSTLAALHTSQQPSIRALLVPLLNELTRLADPTVVVLEDIHAITSAEIHETLAYLVNHKPDSLHLVLLSRGAPPLPLATWRARGQLSEIDAADLRFSPSETQEFLSQQARSATPPEVAELLEQRTEGWAAGLRLASVALQGQLAAADAEQWIGAFSGSHPFISDYLVREVFSRLPEETHSFLLQTSFLGRLTGALCNALTGCGDGESQLAALERANLFITQLGGAGERAWYRYHPLFAEALQPLARQKLGEEAVCTLFAKASRWYQEHRMVPEAIDAALEAGDFHTAAGLISSQLEQRGLSEIYTLRRWAERIPQEILADYPEVCFNYAQALLYSTDRFSLKTPELLAPWLGMAEKAWEAAGNAPRLGAILAFRGIVAWFHGDFAQVFTLSRQALELIPEQDIYWRGTALLGTIYEAVFAGHSDTALEQTLEARAMLGAAQNFPAALAATQILAEVNASRGELELARQIGQQVLADAVGDVAMLDDQGNARLTLSAVAYERDQLDEAGEHARLALDAGEHRANEWLQAFGAIALAQVEIARGALDRAQSILRAALPKAYHPYFQREVQDAQARVALQSGALEPAREWAAARLGRREELPGAQQERQHVLLARLYLAEGRPADALAQLDGWAEDAAAHERVRSQALILCLTALACDAAGDAERASHALTRALAVGESKGLRRTFLDLGEPLARLVRAALPTLPRRALAAYAAGLFPTDTGSTRGKPGADGSLALLEPLSAQELRVLRLLAAGLSNPEIAQELVVSTNTIKTQVKSIFRKLDVNSRKEARDTARELELL